MNVFYTRLENDREIVITYKPWFTWLFVLALPVWAYAGMQPDASPARAVAGAMWMVVLLVLLWRVLAMRGVWREIRDAMRKGGVTMKGTKFNPRDPLTFSIAK